MEHVDVKYEGFALFDLDQTLVPWDMQLLYANWIFHKYPLRRVFLLLFLCALPLGKLLGARRLKRLFLAILYGLSEEEIESIGQEFVDHYHPQLFYPDVVAKLKEHLAKNHCVILTSASPSLYVKMIGEKLNVTHTFCTEVGISGKMPLIPQILINNKREDKIVALRHWLEQKNIKSQLPLPNSISYTDSSADLPLLAAAERGVLVHPSDSLINTVKRNNQPYDIMLPPRPFKNTKSAKLLCALKLLFGIYPL